MQPAAPQFTETAGHWDGSGFVSRHRFSDAV